MVRRTVLGGNVGLDRGEVDGCLDELVVVGVLLGRGEHLKESAARAVAIHGSSARTRFPLRRGGFKRRWAEMLLRRRSKMESMACISAAWSVGEERTELQRRRSS